MLNVRIHGRGGQGVVTAAEMLSLASFAEGKFAQAFPSFGSERMGAPVVAYCRISDSPIRLREPVLNPDFLIIQDPTLLVASEIFDGVCNKTVVIINYSKDIENIADKIPSNVKIVPVSASEIALKYIGRPIPNVVLLSAFAGVTGVVTLESIHGAIRKKFSGSICEKNIEAADAVYKMVTN